MINFQDRTFCAAEECLRFKACSRALTPKVKAAAVRWWGSEEAPIAAYTKPETLACYQVPSRHERS